MCRPGPSYSRIDVLGNRWLLSPSLLVLLSSFSLPLSLLPRSFYLPLPSLPLHDGATTRRRTACRLSLFSHSLLVPLKPSPVRSASCLRQHAAFFLFVFQPTLSRRQSPLVRIRNGSLLLLSCSTPSTDYCCILIPTLAFPRILLAPLGNCYFVIAANIISPPSTCGTDNTLLARLISGTSFADELCCTIAPLSPTATNDTLRLCGLPWLLLPLICQTIGARALPSVNTPLLKKRPPLYPTIHRGSRKHLAHFVH